MHAEVDRARDVEEAIMYKIYEPRARRSKGQRMLTSRYTYTHVARIINICWLVRKRRERKANRFDGGETGSSRAIEREAHSTSSTISIDLEDVDQTRGSRRIRVGQGRRVVLLLVSLFAGFTPNVTFRERGIERSKGRSAKDKTRGTRSSG